MGNWKDALVGPRDSLLTAIESIGRGVLQISLVIDDAGRLLGSVTDGDIRRAILKGVELNQPVSLIMNKDPFCVAPDYDKEDLKEVMLSHRYHQVPVVDHKRRVVDLVIIEDLFKRARHKDNWVVLMAGGLGTRLQPLTDTTPKPLIEVGGKPILETIIDKFVSQGFENFYLSVNYKGEQIKDYFGDGSNWNAQIRYLSEDQRLGTAGALSLIEEPLSEPVIVMNADLVTDVDFNRILHFHLEQRAKGTMAVRAYEFQVDFGVVELNEARISAISEKPVHKFMVNAGIYVLDQNSLAEIPKNMAIDMPALFERWLAAGDDCAAFPIHEYWLDVGRIEDLERAKQSAKRVGGSPK